MAGVARRPQKGHPAPRAALGEVSVNSPAALPPPISSRTRSRGGDLPPAAAPLKNSEFEVFTGDDASPGPSPPSPVSAETLQSSGDDVDMGSPLPERDAALPPVGPPARGVLPIPDLPDISQGFYLLDILQTLREREVDDAYRIDRDFIAWQREITIDMYRIVVDWVVEVAGQYEFATETLQLALNYLQRFLCRRQVPRGERKTLPVAHAFFPFFADSVFE
jgi:Cyclin, N-terminal domain